MKPRGATTAEGGALVLTVAKNAVNAWAIPRRVPGVGGVTGSTSVTGGVAGCVGPTNSSGPKISGSFLLSTRVVVGAGGGPMGMSGSTGGGGSGGSAAAGAGVASASRNGAGPRRNK